MNKPAREIPDWLFAIAKRCFLLMGSFGYGFFPNLI